MLGYVPFPPITDKPYPLSLAPYSFFWLELQPGPEAPRPSALPQQNEATEIIMRPLKPSNEVAENPPST
jgi:maltose alpha-D-glucosyltransferase/alpha-amylase